MFVGTIVRATIYMYIIAVSIEKQINTFRNVIKYG